MVEDQAFIDVGKLAAPQLGHGQADLFSQYLDHLLHTGFAVSANGIEPGAAQDETAEQGHLVFDGGAVEFQHIWGEHDIICQPNNGLTDYWRTQMTKHTNKDITHEDYEAIRKWIENQCEDTAEVIHTLFTSFPFV